MAHVRGDGDGARRQPGLGRHARRVPSPSPRTCAMAARRAPARDGDGRESSQALAATLDQRRKRSRATTEAPPTSPPTVAPAGPMTNAGVRRIAMRPEYCTGGAFSSRSPGGVKRGPMLRPLAVAIALAALAACARPGPARSPNVMPPGTARIAVVPFRTAGAPCAEAGGGGEGVPADAGPAAARMLAAHLAETGMAVVDADRVLGAWSLADTTAYDPRVAAHVAEKVGANLAVLGTLSRYRERQGTAW